jgi:hypothetical protein
MRAVTVMVIELTTAAVHFLLSVLLYVPKRTL